MSSIDFLQWKRPLIISVALICVAYVLAALWCGHTIGNGLLEDVLPRSTATNPTCDYLKKYVLSQGPKGDANMWLLENYLDINFDSRILNDPQCLGALLSDMSSNVLAGRYRSKIEMRFLNERTGDVLIRLHYKL